MNLLLTEQDYKQASAQLGIELAVIKAVAKVESRGSGFLSSGKPVILFEGHKFSKYTNGQYDKIEPTISYPKWTRKHYLGGEREYERFHIASALDHTAALLSTSWGKFQIMGFNYKFCGYKNLSSFVYDMQTSERYQLLAFVTFIENMQLVELLRKHQWSKFALAYNGSGYKKNKYHIKLARTYKEYVS